MTIRLLSPDLVRNRCDEVSDWATVWSAAMFVIAGDLDAARARK